MVEPTNKERLGKIETSIVNIDKNFTEFKDDYKESDVRRWKSINKNTTDIAKMKGMGGVLALIFTAVCGYQGIKQ